jgi:hypothetical protein
MTRPRRPSRRPPRRLPPPAALLLPALLLATLLPAAPVRAELVVFAEGSFLKVAGYRVDGEKMRLSLLEGGTMSVSLARVERVVDDEVVPEPEPIAVPALHRAGLPIPLAFSDDLPVPPIPFGAEIYQAAKRHSLNPQIVAAVVRAESAFDRGAVSPKGARGLMQLMPATARRFGVGGHEIHDPVKNLDAGSRYLRWLLDHFDGDLLKALAAYNAGEGTVDRYGGVPPYRETRGYGRRIYSTLGLELSL